MIYKMAQNEDFKVQTKSGGIVNVPPASGDTELVTKKEAEDGWWSEWVCDPAEIETDAAVVEWTQGGWIVKGQDTGSVYTPVPKGTQDSDTLSWSAEEAIHAIAATRHRVLGLSSETWTFVLDGGSQVTKTVCLQ